METDHRPYYVRLLQSCTTNTSRHLLYKQTHALFIKKCYLNSITTLANHLLQIYTRTNNIKTAQKLFDEMPEKNIFTYNTMIEGYIKSGDKRTSLKLFYTMPKRDNYSWNLVVSAFAKSEVSVAKKLYDVMPEKDLKSLNALICGYSLKGLNNEALKLFKEFKGEDDLVLMTSVVGVCAKLGSLRFGKEVHCRVLVKGFEFDEMLNSSLVNLYVKCGDLRMAKGLVEQSKEPDEYSLCSLISGYASCGNVDEARRVFDGRSNRCVVLWNVMISGYVDNNMEVEALVLFREMRYEAKGDCCTLAAVVKACSGLGSLEIGKKMHSHGFKCGFVDDVVVVSTLLDMYSVCGSPMEACKLFSEVKTYDTVLLNCMIKVYFSCGKIEDAKRVFKRIENKSLISWNSMIVGFSQNGYVAETLEYFREMYKLDLLTDKFSLSSVISTCASVSLLELGEQVFARATVIGLDSDEIVSSALIDLYCKCGFVEHGRRVFDTIVSSDAISWNAMISGYATNGYGLEAIDLFNKMSDTGIRPTRVTFMGVLTACNYCGLVEEGRSLFKAMKLVADKEHVSCMVDLLARAGYVEEAIDVIKEMSSVADTSMWSSVLRACVANGYKDLGKEAAEKIIELEPENSGAYVLLSTIFADSGDWENSAFVRELMRVKHVRKNPGSSWIDC